MWPWRCSSPLVCPMRVPRRAPRGDDLGDEVVTVGSFDFAESGLLAEIYSQALEGGGIRVRRAVRPRPPRVRRPRARRGPGRARARVRGHRAPVPEPRRGGSRTSTSTRRTRRSSRALEDTHVTALDAAPAQDANAFVVTARDGGALRPAHAQRSGAASRPSSRSAARRSARPGRCASSGCEQVYGLKFKEFVAARRRRSRHPPGAPDRRRRRRAPVHDRSRDRATEASSSCSRRPRTAAGGERHPARAHRGRRPVRPAARRSRRTRCRQRLTTDVLRELERAGGARATRRRRSRRRWLDGGGPAMTTDAPTTAPARAGTARITSRSAGPAQARHLRRRRRPSGAAPPLPRKHRVHRHGLAGRLGAPARLDGRRDQLADGRARVTDRVDAASCARSRGCAPTGSPTSMDAIDRVGVGLDGHRRRRSRCSSRSWCSGAGATCSRSLGSHRSCSSSSASMLYDGFARPRPVRRHDHRPLGAASRSRRRPWRSSRSSLIGDHLHARRRRAGRARSRSGRRRRSWSCSPRSQLYLGVVPPVRRRSSASRFAVAIAAQRVPVLHPERGLPGRLPAGQDRAPRRRRPAGRGDPPGGAGPARAHGASTSSRSGSPARAARRRCGSASRATPTRTCSPSSTR